MNVDMDLEDADEDTASENLSECARTQRRRRRELLEEQDVEEEGSGEGQVDSDPVVQDDIGDDLKYEEVEEKAVTTVAASVEQCIDLVRNAWSNRHESEGVVRGQQWANRHRVGNASGLNGLEVSSKDSVARGPEEILRQRHVVDNTWTHLILHPHHCRSQVLVTEDARDLYTSLSVESYRDMGMGIMNGPSLVARTARSRSEYSLVSLGCLSRWSLVAQPSLAKPPSCSGWVPPYGRWHRASTRP